MIDSIFDFSRGEQPLEKVLERLKKEHPKLFVRVMEASPDRYFEEDYGEEEDDQQVSGK